jgi:hypothetical protein
MTDVASRPHGAARVDLLHEAVANFDVAARWGLAVCMAVVLLSAAGGAIGLTRGDSGQTRSRSCRPIAVAMRVQQERTAAPTDARISFRGAHPGRPRCRSP